MSEKKHTILVVEDNQAMRKIFESMLIDLGYNYISVVNGLKAWEKIQEEEIDLVLCDYLMPEMNGIELLRRIRQTRRFFDMPFIMVTSADKRAEFLKSVHAEVDYYILKPTTVKQLDELLLKVIANLESPSEYSKAINNGKYFFLNREFDKAEQSFNLARKIRKDSALPYYYLGLISQQFDKQKDAEQYFKQSLKIEKNFISAMLALAEIYQTNKDYANLTIYLEQLTTLMPDTFDVHIGLAHACIQTGELDRAKRHLDAGQQIAKSNIDQVKEVLEGYIEGGFVDEADVLFGKKLQNSNNDDTLRFLNRLGLRSRKMKNYEKAEYFYMNCLKLNPQSKIVNYNITSLFFLQKQYEDAESYAKKLLRLYPDFKEAKDLMDAIQQNLPEKGDF